MRPFPCDKCNLAFKCSNGLKSHMMSVHSDMKHFVCQHCGSGFSTSSGVSRHQKNNRCSGLKAIAASDRERQISSRGKDAWNLTKNEIMEPWLQVLNPRVTTTQLHSVVLWRRRIRWLCQMWAGRVQCCRACSTSTTLLQPPPTPASAWPCSSTGTSSQDNHCSSLVNSAIGSDTSLWNCDQWQSVAWVKIVFPNTINIYFHSHLQYSLIISKAA